MKNKLFKNNKNGNLYQVLYAGIDRTNCRDGTQVIIYSPIKYPDEVSVRETVEFYEKFTEA